MASQQETLGLWGRLAFVAALIALAAFKAFPLEEKITLGLDLQGGTHLVLEVDLDEAVRSHSERVAEGLRRELEEAGVPFGNVTQQATGTLLVTGVPAGSRDAAGVLLDQWSAEWKVDWDGESAELRLRNAANKEIRDGSANQVKETIGRRVDEFGVREPKVTLAGNSGERIVLQLPGLEDVERVKGIITRSSVLEFRLGLGDADTREALEAQLGPTLLENADLFPGGAAERMAGRWFALEKSSVARGEDLLTARVEQDRYSRPAIGFTLGREASRRFGEFTGKHRGDFLAILLDGRVVTYAVIQAQIFSSGIIEGSYTLQEAQDEALTLRSGALPAKVQILFEQTVGPGLGRESIQAGLRAALLGLAVVLVFMLLWYKGAGVNAVVALGLNILFVLALLATLQATLTLPGIAGLILTIGMAVDANVIIFERIKEELALGKSPRAAVESGFGKAFWTIFDANVTTLVAAFFLYNFGTGPIKGFAVTLSLGILCSMFTAIFVSRRLFDLGFWFRGRSSSLSIQWRTARTPHFRMLDWRRVAAALSAAVILGSFGLWAAKGLNYGIDFLGGTQIIVKTAPGKTADDLRQRFAGSEFSDIQIQRFGDASLNEFLLRVSGAERAVSTTTVNAPEDDEQQGAASRVVALLQEGDAEGAYEAIGVESVGPSIGAELKSRARSAVVWSLLAILMYIWVRFEFRFGIAAIVALAHDVVVTLGVLVLIGQEINISIIAALLTIVGYSLNDTIVVFDRVRENIGTMRKQGLVGVLTTSINQTLSRTVLTSSTTLLVTFSLLLFGGAVLNGFALALTVGVLVGTYSSVFVASPVLLFWERRRARKLEEEVAA